MRRELTSKDRLFIEITFWELNNVPDQSTLTIAKKSVL